MLEGLLAVLNVETMILVFVGLIVGVVFGSLPGLTTTMAVAIILPMTFGMNPLNGLAILIGAYIGGTTGGLITAILIGIPGTPASVATTFDGYPMTQNGEAGRALGGGIFFSALATLLSILVLMVAAQPIANVAVRFGPIEMFSVTLLALTMISTLVSGNVLKGLIAAVMGITFALFGFAPVGAMPRFVFHHQFAAGFDMLPLMVGLFAISEVINMAANYKSDDKTLKIDTNFKIKGFGIGLQDIKGQIVNFFRSSAIGIGIGVFPGIGASTSNVIAYSVAKNQSKHPEKFGTGVLDGLVASEASNNATLGSTMIPLLTLGIPGDTVTAVMLGALMIHGIIPGPLLFRNSPELINGIFSLYLIAVVLLVVVMYGGIKLFIRVLSVPKHVMMTLVALLCVVGALAANFRIFDVWTALFFGVLGFFMNKFKFPMTPMIMGFVLGGIVEVNLVRGLGFAGGSFFAFFQSPIAAVFLSLSIISILWSIIKPMIKRKPKQTQGD